MNICSVCLNFLSKEVANFNSPYKKKKMQGMFDLKMVLKKIVLNQIHFIEVASRASICCQVQTTTLQAPDEPPSRWLGDPAPFLLECISELSDVLWLVKLSPDMSPKDVPQMFKWKRVWGLCWPWESHDYVKLPMILDNVCMNDGLLCFHLER